MKKLIIPALALLFSVCKVQAQSVAMAHPIKHEKKTMSSQPKKTTTTSTTVTMRKDQPATKTQKQAIVRKNATASHNQAAAKTTQPKVRRTTVPTANTNRADTTRPKHIYAKAHMKHTHPAKKMKTKTTEKTK